MTVLQQVLDAIDTANARDPRQDDGQPEALLYGHRMSAELSRLYPDASDLLQIAARGQHVERWVLARSDYDEGKAGYLKWRRDLATHHANRVGAMMTGAGYGAAVRRALSIAPIRTATRAVADSTSGSARSNSSPCET